MRQFDVALWRSRNAFWPEWTGTLFAPSAFSAVVQLMEVYGLVAVSWAVANARDGSIRYSCFDVSGINWGPIWLSHRGPHRKKG